MMPVNRTLLLRFPWVTAGHGAPGAFLSADRTGSGFAIRRSRDVLSLFSMAATGVEAALEAGFMRIEKNIDGRRKKS